MNFFKTLDTFNVLFYILIMEFQMKTLNNCMEVNRIANLHFFEFPKDFYTASDKHSFCELVYVASGALEIQSDRYNGPLRKGEMILHTAWENHSLRCLTTNAPTVIIIGFEYKGDDLSFLSVKPTILSAPNIDILADIVKEGRNIFAPPYNIPTYDMKKKENIPFGSEQSLKMLIQQFLISLIRINQITNDAEPPVKHSGYQINQIVAYVDENLFEKITIDELAFIFGTNRSSLCKEFKNKTGYSLNRYKDLKRIEKIKHLLCNTDYTMTEIAQLTNFTSVHYFSNFFKNAVGIAPNKYKQQNCKRTRY